MSSTVKIWSPKLKLLLERIMVADCNPSLRAFLVELIQYLDNIENELEYLSQVHRE